MEEGKQRSIITDKLIVEKTGKPLEHWFSLLDQKGAKDLLHVEIFKLAGSIKGLDQLGEWNQNLLTTSYEWSRGLKARGEKGGAFEVSISKTVAAPITKLYKAWVNDEFRNKWLPGERIIIRKATQDKSARITWSDGTTSLSVDFYSKDAAKSQVVVQHQKIKDSETATQLKAYWAKMLNSLKELLEK